MNLKEGAFLHNDTYRIERVLGQGGFGITYLAVHMRLKKKVAIKEFFPKAFCDREADTSHVRTASAANSVTVEKLRNKFIKEAEHIAEMDSPYIVRITDVFEENHTAYYVMDYIEGRSLSDIVKNDGPLPVGQAVEYISKIGEALAYIHSKRMNHLDVKPANIMVRSKDNAPILIDFGLSKQYDSEGNQTSTTPVGISHGYAPIEQYRDGGVKEFSPQTDLYSLAATLYYLLSGVVPPHSTNLLDEDITFPNSIPSNLVKPLKKAMSASRKDRHESISQFLKEIRSEKFSNDEDTVFSFSHNNVNSNDRNGNDTSIISDTPEKPFYKQKGFIISAIIGTIVVLVILFLSEYTPNSSYNGSNDVTVDSEEVVAVEVVEVVPEDEYVTDSVVAVESTSNVKSNMASKHSQSSPKDNIEEEYVINADDWVVVEEVSYDELDTCIADSVVAW